MSVLDVINEFEINVVEAFSFKVNDYRKILEEIPWYKTGVYIFFDENHQPLYVGKSEKIKDRLKSHFKGFSSETKMHIDNIKYCSLLLLKRGSTSLEWLETVVINEYKPPLNTVRNKWRWERLLTPKYKHRCKGTNSRNENCGLSALENGFCKNHGGIGKKWNELVEEDMRKLGFN
ncbi:GIY-YIG nuclease family protein [Priestia flexa]|uniref:Excinuclease cho n=1 Tax=Priestia flexa TaxID=86664 RepID=A0ABU4J2C9_9BACI|nr:GIY-YIG nuclease family protein [Priestia flexa]MDW8515140.1 GIY-YIG nuclease family protein [Priestia flexa]